MNDIFIGQLSNFAAQLKVRFEFCENDIFLKLKNLVKKSQYFFSDHTTCYFFYKTVLQEVEETIFKPINHVQKH